MHRYAKGFPTTPIYVVVFSVLFGSACLNGLSGQLGAVSYKVSEEPSPKKHLMGDGDLTVTGAEVHYVPAKPRTGEYNMSCAHPRWPSRLGPTYRNWFLASGPSYLLGRERRAGGGHPPGESRKHAASQTAEAERAQKERFEQNARAAAELAAGREKERQRLAEEIKEANQKKAADFRDAVIKAWRATGEREPFASLRGDYDLSAPDSRQWKATTQLPDAERCALFITPPQTTTAAPLWTYACEFSRAAQPSPRERFDTYERIVGAIQSALEVKFQPDVAATGVNQVFFSDALDPNWRFIVTKIGDGARVLVWIAPTVAGNGPSATPFGPAATSSYAPPSDATIRGEIEKVRRGKYTPLPQIQATGAGASRNGMAVFEVRNDTAYTLTALFSGPIERRVEVAPGSSTAIELPPGAYKLVGRVNAPDVLPSYGEHTFDQSSSGLRFFLQ